MNILHTVMNVIQLLVNSTELNEENLMLTTLFQKVKVNMYWSMLTKKSAAIVDSCTFTAFFITPIKHSLGGGVHFRLQAI